MATVYHAQSGSWVEAGMGVPPGASRFLMGMTEDEILALPQSGAAWNQVVTNSNKTLVNGSTDSDVGVSMTGTGSISSRAASNAFCMGLRYVASGDATYRTKVTNAIDYLVDTYAQAPYGSAVEPYYSALARQMCGWIMASDLCDYRPTEWVEFLTEVRYRALSSHSRWNSWWKTAWDSFNNHGTLAMASMMAANLFLDIDTETTPHSNTGGYLQCLDIFKRFCGAPATWDTWSNETSSFGGTAANGTPESLTWAHDSADWVGINPAAAIPQKEGVVIMDVERDDTAYSTDGSGNPVPGPDGVAGNGYIFTAGQGFMATAALVAANLDVDVWGYGDDALGRWRAWVARYGFTMPFQSYNGWMDPLINHIYGTSYTAVDAGGYSFAATRWLAQNTDWLKV